MPDRRVAPLCVMLLLPSLAFAAPPEDQPPLQRPSKGGEGGGDSPTETGDPDTPGVEGEDNSVSGDTVDSDPEAATPGDPSESGPDAATDEAGEEPEPEPEEDLSNLLASDEPDQPTPRVRVSNTGRPSGVDRNERLRNYYARIYRPEHNPSRIYFAARGAYALSGTSEGVGGGRMGFANVEVGQTWNFIGYGIGAAVYAGGLTFGQDGVEKFGGVLVGGGPSLGLGRLGLLGRGYIDARIGYNFFYAPISSTRVGLADPPDAAPHGPKVQLDAGLLLHDSERRRFRHGFGASIGWQLLVHSLAGEYPLVNTFTLGINYFFG